MISGASRSDLGCLFCLVMVFSAEFAGAHSCAFFKILCEVELVGIAEVFGYFLDADAVVKQASFRDPDAVVEDIVDGALTEEFFKHAVEGAWACSGKVAELAQGETVAYVGMDKFQDSGQFLRIFPGAVFFV